MEARYPPRSPSTPLDVVNRRLTHLAAPVLQTSISVRRLDKHFPHVEERFMVWRVMDARGKLKEDVEKAKEFLDFV